MAVRFKGFLSKLAPERSRAARVLASRDEETVGYWTLPEHHGVEIAFFLQFHDSDDQALAKRKARIRVAYRNFQPETLHFKRRIGSSGSTVEDYKEDDELIIWAARNDDDRAPYVERILDDAVGVRKRPDRSELQAKIEFTEPQQYRVLGVDEFRFAFPDGGNAKCVCCLQFFRI
ncbi:MAG TPA: hypothetical protein VIM33_14140 [Gaiellaceae bacterium]|jgi:hypothetical protein